MPTIDFNDPEMAKHLSYAIQYYERERDAGRLLKVLRGRDGLDDETAAAIVQRIKQDYSGPARKAGALKCAGGAALIVLTIILVIATDRLFWYIGGAGIFLVVMGLVQMVTGVEASGD